jgi:hypothetical protein
MTDEELTRRVRASRNIAPAANDAPDDWPDAPLPMPERAREARIGLTMLAAFALPWLPLLWWIFRNV